jgi:flagellar protein FlaG
MNEVRPTQVAVPLVTRAASSQGVDGASTLPQGGKVLPAMEAKPDVNESVSTQIEKAVSEINEYIQSVQRDIHFSVDDESGLTIIRVHDKTSGDLIRQIPEDVFLNLAQNLKDNQTLHLFDAHG